MTEGWIKLHRKFMDWEWRQDPNMVSLFIHLLLEANHEQKRWMGVEINPGQLVTGRLKLSEYTGISEQTIRTCLNKLKSTNEITIKVTNKFSLITITKWDIYQGKVDKTNQINNQISNQQLTNNQPTTNHKQECKEVKNVRKKEIKTFSSDSIEYGLSLLLFNLIRDRKPDIKEPDMQKWAGYIDKMIRIDHRLPERIRPVIEWCQKDEFWQNNILSTDKLRKQYDQLTLKMGNNTPKSIGTIKTADDFDLDEFIREVKK